MRTLNFALVGCGRISKRHLELLGRGNVANSRLTAVCDVVTDRAAAVGHTYSVPFYTDMHRMMQTQAIDAVVVLTESGQHADHVVALAQYKKHIMVEKPMALTLTDADRMIAACDQAGIKLFVVKQNRFNV